MLASHASLDTAESSLDDVAAKIAAALANDDCRAGGRRWAALGGAPESPAHEPRAADSHSKTSKVVPCATEIPDHLRARW